MNPGPVEEASKVAVSVADAMRSQPLVLLVLILNVTFLLMFFWILSAVRADNRLEFGLLKATCDAVIAK